ncbi:MAG TPA: right-handed parallel beta-helix repeat-containing protein, partial [Thermoanaerobaculia bacterium]
MTFASVAHAQATRTWVSGVGDDANPCSRTAPCKTFAGAISKTAPGGEINVLDPGGFGAVTITKSITISSAGFEAGVLVSGTNGIIVSAAATDTVVLRGLDFEGLGTGLSGILFLTGGTLHVENCTINNFVNQGIDIQATSANVSVKDSIIRNNSNASNLGGIRLRGGASTVLNVDRTRLERNVIGVRVESGTAVIHDSVIFKNT